MPSRGFDMSFEIDGAVRLGFLQAPQFPGVSYENVPSAMVALMVHWYISNLTKVLSYLPPVSVCLSISKVSTVSCYSGQFSLQFIVLPFPPAHQNGGCFVQTIILVQLRRGWAYSPADLLSLAFGLSPHNIETRFSFSSRVPMSS